MKAHEFKTELRWTGNLGQGTKAYAGYSRNHEFVGPSKHVLPGSSDPMFGGDGSRYNPEELLVASLAACHMLWYLHLCANAGIVVVEYSDHSSGTMRMHPDGAGEFTEVVLRPEVVVEPGADRLLAMELHDKAHELCFIARSMNFPVRHDPRLRVAA